MRTITIWFTTAYTGRGNFPGVLTAQLRALIQGIQSVFNLEFGDGVFTIQGAEQTDSNPGDPLVISGVSPTADEDLQVREILLQLFYPTEDGKKAISSSSSHMAIELLKVRRRLIGVAGPIQFILTESQS